MKDKVYKEKILENLAMSFAGNKDSEGDLMLNYIIGPEVKDRENELEERCKTLRTCMMFPLYLSGLYPTHGRVYALRETDYDTAKNGDSATAGVMNCETKNLTLRTPLVLNAEEEKDSNSHDLPSGLAVVTFFPKGYNAWLITQIWRTVKVFMKVGGPSGSTKGYLPNLFAKSDKETTIKQGRFNLRSGVMDKMMEQKHKKLMKGKPHIHVMIVSVLPEAQGQRICSRTMRAINDMADQLNFSCYLECAGERRVGIYNRYGYEVADTVELTTPKCDNEPSQAGWTCEKVYLTRFFYNPTQKNSFFGPF